MGRMEILTGVERRRGAGDYVVEDERIELERVRVGPREPQRVGRLPV